MDLTFLTPATNNSFETATLSTDGRLKPSWGGLVKRDPADFVVEEVMGFPFTGHGEHVVLSIRKQGLNTVDVVDLIHRVSGVAKKHIGYSGLKDKHATTTQWFSVPIPQHRRPCWTGLESDRVKLIDANRHIRKIKRGSHRGNRFVIKVRDYCGDMKVVQQKLVSIRATGVPNYFGPQRFGYSNLDQAKTFFSGGGRGVSRYQRGILLSAARSHIFNQVLSHRVGTGTWDRFIPGDVASLNGSNSYFPVSEVTPDLMDRLERCDIHPSGPLFGRGENPAQGDARAVEDHVFAHNRIFCEGLTRWALRFERRALRLVVADLQWSLSTEAVLSLHFSLTTGGFATAVLQELP